MLKPPDAPSEKRSRLFEPHRRYLFAVAYRILGIAEDAEDVVQDAWLRFASAPIDVSDLERPRGYLVTIVTRLAIDVLRSARRQREDYVGVWLPEPIPTAEALVPDPVESAESVSIAFLLLLERLNPVERAVLVLHDVFDLSHAEIASAIDKSAAASRQALKRARDELGRRGTPLRPGRARSTSPSSHGNELAKRFLTASRTGDLDSLASVLAQDVVLMSDGGGKAKGGQSSARGATGRRALLRGDLRPGAGQGRAASGRAQRDGSETSRHRRRPCAARRGSRPGSRRYP